MNMKAKDVKDTEKLELLKAFLAENNIEHWLNVRVKEVNDVIIPLYIKKYRVAVHVGDDKAWFDAVKRYTHPVFIREEDTPDFVIEKVQNTIITHMTRKQAYTQRKAYNKAHKERFAKFPYHPKKDPMKNLRILNSMVSEEKFCVEPEPEPKKKKTPKQ